MIKNVSFIFLCILCLGHGLKAQETEELRCQVVDLDLKFPVVFATVQLQNEEHGVIADENGYFRLPLRYQKQGATIIISAIGYATKKISLQSLKINSINTIELQRRVESLGEITLVAGNAKKNVLSAQSIVEKAIRKIGANHPNTPYSYIGYYRDYQLLNNKYTNLNESIMEVFDAGFTTDKLLDSLNQTVLYSYKKNENFLRDSMTSVPYDKGYKFIKYSKISPLGGNELSILDLHDPIRNYKRNTFSFVHVLKDNFIQNHEFKLANIHYFDETPLYEITFNANRKITGAKNAARGTIYIARKNHAIHKLEYYGYVVNDSEPLFSVKLQYSPKGKHMFLNYISFNNFFQIRSKDDFKVTDITFDGILNAVYVTFNNAVNKSSVANAKNFKFIYKKRKLPISKITLSEPNVVMVHLVKGAIATKDAADEAALNAIKYKIKNITDTSNRQLNKTTFIDVNQFRELFVQQVFPNKKIPIQNMHLVNKGAPLFHSQVNKSKGTSKYWVNSPLKASKK